jgi:hypothetical protein
MKRNQLLTTFMLVALLSAISLPGTAAAHPTFRDTARTVMVHHGTGHSAKYQRNREAHFHRHSHHGVRQGPVVPHSRQSGHALLPSLRIEIVL